MKPSETDASPEPPLITKAFALLVSGHFLQALGYASAPLLPLYLGYLDASRTEIGVIMAMASVGGLVMRPVVGWVLDVLGRKPTLVAGTASLVVGMALIGLVDTVGPLLYTSRIIYGVGVGALFTGYFTFAADIIPESRRTEGIALFGISGLLPLAVNPFIGELGIAAGDLRWVFPALGGVIALSMLSIWSLREPEGDDDEDTEPVSPGAIARAIRKPVLWPVWLSTTIFSGLLAVFMAFATVAAESRGVENPAGLWLTYAGGAICVRLFGARLPDRIGPTNLVAPALGTYGLAMLMASWASSAPMFLVAGFLAGIGHGYCFPVLTSQVVNRTPRFLRGSAMAMFTALWEVSALGLTPLFGAIADWTSDATMFAFSAICVAGGLAIWAALEHRLGVETTDPDAVSISKPPPGA